jgi:hypothetical protein
MILLKNLRVAQLDKKFPEFYETEKFITMFRRAPLVSILWQMNPVLSHHFKIYFDIIFPPALRSLK